jgi:hypothetical protein
MISFYEYAVNIQKLVPDLYTHELDERGNVVSWSFGNDLLLPTRTLPIWPSEIFIMITNIICMIILIRSNSTLKELRNEFKDGIFEKLTNPKNNFMYQLLFYFLKRLHVFVLCGIFAFVFTGLNIYFIGLLYFFLRYVSSIKAYRSSGPRLLAFAGFFIWLNYIWSLLKKNGVSFDDNIDKFLDILTLAVQKPAE